MSKTNVNAKLRPLLVPIADLNHDPDNARSHDDRNIEAVMASLKQFGMRKPIVVQKQGMVVRAGNATLEAARRLGWTQVAAVVVDDDEATAKAFGLADNRTAELASWDDDALKGVLESLDGHDALIDATGFDQDDIAAMMGDAGGSGGSNLNEVKVKGLPKMAWALVGIPIGRWGEVAPTIESLSQIDGAIVETATNDAEGEDAGA